MADGTNPPVIGYVLINIMLKFYVFELERIFLLFPSTTGRSEVIRLYAQIQCLAYSSRANTW